MIKKIGILLILILLLNCNAFAIMDVNTENQKISIKEAVELATQRNLEIQASRLDLEIGKNDIKAATRFQNPSIGLFHNLGKAGRGNPQEIGVSQLFEINKRGARKALAKSNFKIKEEYVKYLEFDLRMDVREAYTNLLAKKSVLSTMKQQKDLLQRLHKRAQQKLKEKTATKIEVLQAQILLNQIITEVQAAEYNVKTALYDFNKVINVSAGFYDTEEECFTNDYEPLRIPDVFEKMPEFEDISDRAKKDRFDIKIAKETIENAKKELKLILKQRIPDFELEGGYMYQTNHQSEGLGYKNGAYIEASLVNIPIVYRHTPEIENAKIKVEQAKLNYVSVENKALNDLKKAYEKFLTAQLALQNYHKQLLKNSEELIEASRKSYLNEQTDLTTLVTMEESYRMIQVAYTYALADYYNSWNEFIREVNNEEFTLEN